MLFIIKFKYTFRKRIYQKKHKMNHKLAENSTPNDYSGLFEKSVYECFKVKPDVSHKLPHII